ncbi:MAG: metal-dependent hydrolase [Pseudomonadota bacterium]
MISKTPIPIRVRRMDYDIPEIPRYWYKGNTWITHFMNALSTTFPDGERFFIHAVRNFENDISDPEMRAQIRNFIGQEANHGKEHEAFNQALIDQHQLPLTSKLTFMKKALAFAKKKYSKREQLALTVGFEHFTAILANLMLNQADVIEDLDGMYADMFMWHAVEETEHKAVAFDVFQQVDGDYWLRVRGMAQATFFFMLITTRMQYSLLKHDKQLGNWRDALGFAKFMLFKPGMLTRIIPEYLDFYRPGFHPWQHDNRHLIVDRVKALESYALKAAQAA